MDYPVSPPGVPSPAVVVWANYHQFGPGETRTNWGVESRALVWNKAGVGSIEVGGISIDLTPSTYAFLPWRHDITYRADQRDPFLAAAIHLIPWPDPQAPIALHAPPGRDDHAPGVPTWRDADWPELEGVRHGVTELDGRLLTVARLTVDHVQHGRPEGTTLRALATVLLNELRTGQRDPIAAHASGPPRLARMQQYVLDHLNRPLSMAEVATAGGMSESSAARLFRVHARMSIGQWVIAARMSAARQLLRTTNASVAEVASAVGIDDPSYFSRLFRRTQGVPPSEFARQSWLL